MCWIIQRCRHKQHHLHCTGVDLLCCVSALHIHFVSLVFSWRSVFFSLSTMTLSSLLKVKAFALIFRFVCKQAQV